MTIPRRWRWLAVVLPTVVVGGLELMSDTALDPYLPFPWDTILVTLVVAGLAAIFARVAFGRMDRLAASLEARNAEVEARAASANALHAVSQAIATLADLEAILHATVDNARRLLDADLALLVLTGPDGEPVLRATSGPEDAFDRAGEGGTDDVRRFLRAGHGDTLLAVPLRRGGATIGTLALAGQRTPNHAVGDVETLASLADQAAIAIENDRLAAELRALAVRHERERIAREIHDGLAQVLGYVNTKSQAVEGLLAAGRLDEARAQMAELSAAARSIYVDVRDAIAGLTEPVGPDVELVTEVRDHANHVAEMAKIAVSVRIEAGYESLSLTAAVSDEVFGIIREALTNVRKHAAAHLVTITMGAVDGRLVVTVADDGRGFDPEHQADTPADWPQYGLSTMRRRAAAIDASIEWRSVVDGGTTVTLVVPLDAARPDAPDSTPDPRTVTMAT